MNTLIHNGFEIIIPKPLFLVVEDVGWWQGQDGSSRQEPFRTGMPRKHCLADYEALSYLAKQLSMRILLAMVLCEWDSNDFLQKVGGATWMEESWNNHLNRGPWLEETAHYLRKHQDDLEIALHGVGHEFWQDGRMYRTEFHDNDCWMRSPEIIKTHLDAFGELLDQHNLGAFPRSFIPPALKHSFGNGPDSFQSILHQYGIHFVTTRFSRTRRFSPPLAKHITWEENVLVLERGMSPTPWNVVAASPERPLNGPIVALHWSNLLHPDPGRNYEVVSRWITAIRKSADDAATILVPDIQTCWSQYCHQQLGQLVPMNSGILVNRKNLPPSSYKVDRLFLRVKHPVNCNWKVHSEHIIRKTPEDRTLLLELEASGKELYLQLVAD
ncbi:hypothetical protein [Desulfogranum japonicum]|uniref:hypothetical protein n=1 Tax=Desulfogranum japonicum TaxID=231447 RepID=UPI0003F4DAF3|nr:hypothetical protein [Desulfogranum japonicum]